MDLDLHVLGTAASVPSAARGLSSALVRRGGVRLLIDCGEGTQRQLMRSAAGLGDLDAVLLTHMHADHVLGLPGMLKTFGLRDRVEPLDIVGPPGLQAFMNSMRSVIGRLPYELDIYESDSGSVLRYDDFDIQAVPTEHGVSSVGYLFTEEDRPGRFDVDRARELGVRAGADFGVLQRGGDVTTDDGTVVTSAQVVGEHRHGRRIVYTGDTAACRAIREAAQNATLLVHEATFLHEDAQRAHETGHATAMDAALTAASAEVEMLVLTHVSTRYMPRDIEREARAVFAGTHVARDFDLIELPFPERGAPKFIARGSRPDRDGAAIRPARDEAVQSAE